MPEINICFPLQVVKTSGLFFFYKESMSCHMPNEKLHDIDVFRMEGDTPETPQDPTHPKALRCRVRRFGFQRVGCDTHIFVQKL